MTDSESVRLHITPFNSELLPSVLPPSIRATATEISFHTISTFPENNYGYVTLPKMDAEKIKKKLNGSILKGKKFKIEAARPQKRQLEEEVSAEPIKEKKKSKKSKSEKSEKPEKNTIEGYELPSDRKVKRGWTDPSSGKKDKRKYDKSKSKDDKKEKPQPKSKYSEKAECLFLAKIPPNRVSVPDANDKKAKKKKGSDNVVHEFAKTFTQPSFLRSTDENTPLTATFDEEKGWMDNTGNVKEDVSKKARKKDYLPGKIPGAKEKRPVKTSSKSKSKAKVEEPESSAESEDWTSSSGSDESSDSESESESEDEDEKEKENDDEDSDNASDSSSSSDSDSSDEEEESDEQKPSPEEAKSTDVPMTTDEPEPEASESSSPAEDTPQDSAKEVHPLEALFKRPATETTTEKSTAEPDTGFSFFGNGDDIESDDEPKVSEPQTPFTPFTKRDIQDRGLRSAAPTPDTGIPSRHMKWNEMEDEDEDEDEMAVDTPVSKAREAGADKDETEFSKWFWENRGDNNRAWKKRRRDVAKEQRQRENRKKGMKGKS
ncbi:uncharacterized protein N7483_003101 [Penicillium malachiteum]|uniref:uncharacterized protein n=1 Tax=Penicillium malachiteum TaxID=1324776 RepID=UPI002546ED32|nr:uncharacterized protein N7483_003101 [Penicillium malachiteum]KAJ5728593.1 hypothetical protein N7483_003101 [Penicillium malachiteum]